MKFDVYTSGYHDPGAISQYKTVNTIGSARRIAYGIIDNREVSAVSICVGNWIVGTVKKENGKKFFYSGYYKNKRFQDYAYNKYILKWDGTLGKGIGNKVR